MAKLETFVRGDFQEVTEFIDAQLCQASMSISTEEVFMTEVNGMRIRQNAYERFSYAGGNRTSLSVLFIENEGGVQICGISTGGSQALIFKINTLGENAFLATLSDAVDAWSSRGGL